MMIKKNPKETLSLWLPPIIWALIIFSLSSIKVTSISEFMLWDLIAKKAAHVVEYAIFYLLLHRATGKKFTISYVVLIIYAVTDEFHQKFVMGRTATVIDLGFDISGANIAVYILWKLKQIHQKKPKK